MNAFVTDAAGQRWALPELSAWRLEYTAGVPCDSFWLRCPWEWSNESDPGSWTRFEAEQEGERVFTGVVDEAQLRIDGSGSALELSGRGMAALLLDNEAMGQDYGVATQADILRDHVQPYGIQTAPGAQLPPVSQFSVATGSSEWSVVYDFARYYGGISPRFDRQGRLLLEGWKDSQERVVGDAAPVTDIRRSWKRYGVLSKMLVRDRYSGRVETVENGDFLRAGGMARRVMTMPGRSSYKAMRYSGRFQLERSAAELERVSVTVAQAFCAWPGELVCIQRSGWGQNALMRAAEVVVGMDSRGSWSRLELARPDFVL